MAPSAEPWHWRSGQEAARAEGHQANIWPMTQWEHAWRSMWPSDWPRVQWCLDLVPMPLSNWAIAHVQSLCCACSVCSNSCSPWPPSGIVNYHLLVAVFERLGRKWPDLNGTTKPLKLWVGAMSQSVRIAMAHLRKLAQQPIRFEQRIRGMSKEEKQTLKNLVAMYRNKRTAMWTVASQRLCRQPPGG